MKQISLRGVSSQLAQKLERLSRERNQSVNATVLELLSAAVGIDQRRERLARYTTLSKADQAELDAAIVAQRSVDEKMWR